MSSSHFCSLRKIIIKNLPPVLCFGESKFCWQLAEIRLPYHLGTLYAKWLALTKPWKDCNRICKFLLTQYQTHFDWCHKYLLLLIEHLFIPILNLFIILKIPNYSMNEALNTPPAISPQYQHLLFRRYDEVHSSTGDGVRGSNWSNENEKEINIDDKNKKSVLSVINERSKYTNKRLCTFLFYKMNKYKLWTYQRTHWEVLW